ncbi:hypothetical protein PR003_g26472 [Phytophthora rubi]|uniref:glutamate decarboxylase n=1 Tax=Phytophthora rubi TaxID=129364 RepID=A0A6A4CFE3_9STRA|nr:hypothetical protein PR003_g26472 [Phytophthora rubi]
MVFGSNVQVCWHKTCKYFEIEIREADVSPDCLVLTAERARPLLDENTIGVEAILGSTFNGEYEDIKGIHDMLVDENKRNRWHIPLHSINVSGHKFGLVYAGMGWAIWREKEDLLEDLEFHVNYLGGDQLSFTLNFPKGEDNVVAQYYNLLRSTWTATGLFNIVDKGHMPLVASSLKDSPSCSCFDIQEKLKTRGWTVPAYTCSKGAEGLTAMRVVIKQNYSCQMAKMLVQDILHAVAALEQHSRLLHVLPAKTSMATNSVAVHPMPAVVKIKHSKLGSNKVDDSTAKGPRHVTHLKLCI